MSDNNSPEVKGFILASHAKAKSGFNFTLIVAAIVLSLEGGYLYYLHQKIDTELKEFDVKTYVGNYREDYDVDKYLGYLDYLKKWRNYTNEITMVESYLDLAISLDEMRTSVKIDLDATEAEAISNLDLMTDKIVHEINSQENLIAERIQGYLSENLDELPEWTLNQIPKYGADLRFRVNNWINAFCVSTSDEFGQTFDTFLEEHADGIKEFSESADDEEALAKLDADLTEMIVNMIETVPIEKHGSLKEKSDQFHARVLAAIEMLEPLAKLETNQLDPQQRRLRKAVALFMDKVNNSPGIEGPKPEEKN